MCCPKCSVPLGVYFILIISSVYCNDIKNSILKHFTEIEKCDYENGKFFGTVKSYPDNCESPPKLVGQTITLGCRCADGYVQKSATNTTCVPVGQCDCPPHQKWRYVDGKFIVPLCNKKRKLTVYSRFNRGCSCKKGYALNDDLECVLARYCNT